MSFQAGTSGAESLLEEVESALLERSRREACIELRSTSADEAGSPGLLVSVELGEPRQEVIYDLPLADAVKPGRDPEQAADWEARFDLRVVWTLRILPSGAAVRSGRFMAEARQHAQVVGPDPETFVRQAVVDDVAKRTLRAVCRGSTDSLRKSVAEARAQAKPSR